ncbi:MAG: single-stranded DNA-binding protein [Patescibacteria group bacterium]
MFNLNRAQIIGNLTRDPEVRSLPSGQSVVNFAVATNRRWKDKDGNFKEDTQYHEISVWGRLGELASQMLSKGKKVYVEGRLSTNSWEGNDGVKRQRTEITAESFIPLSPKDSTGFDTAAAIAGGTATELSSSPAAISEEDEKEDEKPVKVEKAKDKKDEKSDEINLDDIPF